MRRSRTLILFAIVLLMVAVALFLWLNRQPPPPKTVQPTAQAVPTQKIVVAFQNIPRGGQIITGAVGLFDWPQTQVPPSAYKDTDINRVVGKFAKIDIPQGWPVGPSMLATSPAEAAAAGGSMAALAIQPGKVGVAFPFRSTYPEKENLPYDRRDKEVLPRLLSVAYAVQPGDRVDVLACFWVYEMDKDFQSRLPNKIGYIDPQNPSKPVEGLAGRPVVAPGGVPGVEAPAEPQLPRMVCQWTVQNARVLGLGDWGVTVTAPTPAPGGGPTPTPAPALPSVATLEVDPQEALVLKYARETGAQIDLVLRAAGDKESKFSTEAVTLQYIFERFRVAIPPKLDYTIGGGGGVPVGATNP
jgi:Flp pilus assembly protein CpaB